MNNIIKSNISADYVGLQRKKGNVVNAKKKSLVNKMQPKYPLKVDLPFHVHQPQTLIKSSTQVIIKNNNVNMVKQSLSRNPSFSKYNKSLNSKRKFSEKSLKKVHIALMSRNENCTKEIYVRLKK